MITIFKAWPLLANRFGHKADGSIHRGASIAQSRFLDVEVLETSGISRLPASDPGSSSRARFFSVPKFQRPVTRITPQCGFGPSSMSFFTPESLATFSTRRLR